MDLAYFFFFLFYEGMVHRAKRGRFLKQILTFDREDKKKLIPAVLIAGLVPSDSRVSNASSDLLQGSVKREWINIFTTLESTCLFTAWKWGAV